MYDDQSMGRPLNLLLPRRRKSSGVLWLLGFMSAIVLAVMLVTAAITVLVVHAAR